MLAQLSTVKARLAILPGDTMYDDLLTRAIQAVSGRFDRECNRTFARAMGATEEFPATDLEIVPRCYPIETVTKFEVKSSEADGWVEQTGVRWLVRRGCVISLNEGLAFVTAGPLADAGVGRVTYTGGYVLPGTTPGAGQTALPADVESAAVEQVAAWFYNKEKLGLIRHWPDLGTYVVLSQQPLLASVASSLRPYRRWGI